VLVVIILGKTNDDKGAQLEALTYKLLEALKYKNCTTNLIASGGGEIDVQGEFEIPHLGNTITRENLCECKAHRQPVGMSDWQKFLGKIFLAERERAHEVNGTFIALSGVNGNVKGSYDSLRQNVDRITLVTGDDLSRLVAKSFALSAIEDVTGKISRLTNRIVRHLEPVYYGGQCFWLATFVGDLFTLLSASGENLAENEAAPLRELVVKEIEAAQYVDLTQEAAAIRRTKASQAWCIGVLMVRNGISTISDLAAESAKLEGESRFSLPEIEAALVELANDNIVDFYAASERASIRIGQRNGIEHVSAQAFRKMLTQGCPGPALGCEFYDRFVNQALLDEILEIQCRVPLSQQEASTALHLLRLSPSGLAQLSEPTEMIVNHRKDQPVNDILNKEDRDLLLQILHERLTKDFSHRQLSKYFLEVRNLREIETRTQIIVKSHEKVELDHTVRERIAVGELAESLGGGYVHVRVCAEMPEPWEEGGMRRPPSADNSLMADQQDVA
jgi:hypothetical protein